MMRGIVRVVSALLSLRYQVKIEGLELLQKDSAQLILPSHIALVDPILLYCILRAKVSIHPVATRKFYDTWVLKPLFKLLGTIPVEDFEKDQGGVEDAEKLMQSLKDHLQQGENVLLYPQGGLAKQGYQSIIGKKSAFYACQVAPKDTRILTISLRGLWGSRSSAARTGKNPNLLLFLIKGVFFYFVNLLFLLPKRQIVVEIRDVSKELRQAEQSGLDIFNMSLEKIYNAKGEETVSYVSAFWAYNTVAHHLPPTKIEGSLDTLRKKVDYSTLKYPKDIFHYIQQRISEIKPEYQGTLDLDTNLVLDLYFDSLDMAELKSSVAAHFPQASNPPLLDLKAVGDVVLMAMGKSPYVEELKPCDWKYPKCSLSLYPPLKKRLTKQDTILTMLKQNFRQDGSLSLCYDQLFGVQSRNDFIIKAYLIADILKTFSGKHIAIMLPSLSATALLIVACYLAEKIPVMLNWTQSEEAFAHCVESQDISVILTAGSFYKKIQTPWLQRYEMTFFEELLKNVSLGQKLKALIASKLFVLPRELDSTAVILFTSGSESLPKAVALSHQNILQDIVGALGRLDAHYDDVLFAFLPPFHSFGFTVNTILPLISGVRAVYMPDPNDAAMINNVIQHTTSTIVASTPTFLKGFLAPAHSDQLSSLRLAVVGAEKVPEELFALAASKAKSTTLVEGYGITECSPIIAVNPFGTPSAR
jgi:long-chain-fatty-acid--[acyl-carrier-protein] ligase